MEIAIKVPDDFYERVNKDGCMSYTDADVVVNAFYCGTVLPKGHRRLIDADALDDNCDWYHTDDDGSWCYKCKDIDNAPTIIEADKEDGK